VSPPVTQKRAPDRRAKNVGTDPADRAAGAGADWPTGRVRFHISKMAAALFLHFTTLYKHRM
jgi:hypothetical protein